MRTLLVCILLAAAIPAAFGQSRKEKAEEAAKRSVAGVVTDADDAAVNGAIVQLKDMKSLQVRSFVTTEEGKFHFFGLSINNDYEVRADFKGAASKTRTLSVFDQRKKAVMDLKLDKKPS